MSKVPVLFLIFDRLETSVESFASIRKYQPDKLYIAADGPRQHVAGEAERCEKTRSEILKMVDWPCTLRTLFRDSNLGCDEAIPGAISWMFESEEYGVIVEDDVVLGEDFFKLCEQMLPQYSSEEGVMMITSQFYGSKPELSKYGFSNYPLIWGWATWRRAWNRMDMRMEGYKSISFGRLFKEYGLFMALMIKSYLDNAYKRVNQGDTHVPWDIRWVCSMLVNNGLSLSPMANLAVNVGCNGVGGVHYSADDKDPFEHLNVEKLDWPVSRIGGIEPTPEILKIERKDFFRLRMIGLRKKIKKLFKR